MTISVAKRPGANATDIGNKGTRQIDLLKGTVIPSDVELTITRNYGKTAADKSNELLFHMAIAVVSVSLLILFTLGWRESIVVAIAILDHTGTHSTRLLYAWVHSESDHPLCPDLQYWYSRG